VPDVFVGAREFAAPRGGSESCDRMGSSTKSASGDVVSAVECRNDSKPCPTNKTELYASSGFVSIGGNLKDV